MSKRRERIAPSFKDPQALTDARKDNQAHTGEGTFAGQDTVSFESGSERLPR